MYELSIALAPAPCSAGECEVFVDIQGYEGYYQVSNYGNVKSLDRVIKEKTGKTQTLKGRILKPRINPGGYYHVGLGKNGTRATFAIHQLVARAFIPNPNKKRTVNHINGDKLSNSVSNLEWSTYSENLEHAFEPPIAESEGFPYRLLTRLSPPSERRYWAVCLTLTGAPTANGSKFFLFVGCA